ncbi:hypothetical protein C8T65DRAFT_636495, partial [Cerioporus squamosus]
MLQASPPRFSWSFCPPIASVDFLAFLLSSCSAPTHQQGSHPPSRAQLGMIGATGFSVLWDDPHPASCNQPTCLDRCCHRHGSFMSRTPPLRASCHISVAATMGFLPCVELATPRFRLELELRAQGCPPFHGYLRTGILPSRQPST